MLGVSADMDPAKQQVRDLRESAAGFKQPVMAAFAVIPLVGAVFPFLCGCLGTAMSGSGTKFAKCGCIIIFLFLFHVCWIMGISQLLSSSFADVCDNIEILITTNVDSPSLSEQLAEQSTRPDNTNTVSQVVLDILKCTTDQTFVGLLGVAEIFNKTRYTS
jgi:hypothetical protein